jgi:Protein of unknown function (DUF1200).
MKSGKKIYRSKVDIRLILFLLAILGGCSAILAYQQIWIGLGIVLFVAAFVAYTFAAIRYVIDGDKLIVKTGIAPVQVIPVGEIRKISFSNSIVSSPATSLSRIGIHYQSPAPLLLSPTNRKQFIADLQAINPAIVVAG